ncbi:substrate-binding domain-containing protein [Streptacidiphilus sp. N1-12]|uniref:Substrate-binding domain-containing protein n=2 Tax=Streptacidiphilus alkalitolerans TaxID=3342712 RepID=A0ABV6WNR5_9ACTN
MLAQQRHDYVLEQLRAHGAIRSTEVVAGLGVSDGTVRRDLELLEQQGRLTRVRGGAVLPPGSTPGAVPRTAVGAAAGPVGGIVIGMLVPSTTYYFPEVIRGAQSAAARAGARLILGVSDYDRERDPGQLRDLVSSGCDGLLVTTAEGPVVPARVRKQLDVSGLPYVLVERRSAAAFDHAECVLSDHRQGAYRAVEYLAGLGHDGVALFASPSPTARAVTEGHAEAVRLLGLSRSAPVLGYEQGADRLSAIDAFVHSCRASGATAALVHSDQEAILLVQRLRAHGVRIPEDLSVIAYDDEVAAFAEVPLTAVAPPKFELGLIAASTLLGRLGAGADGTGTAAGTAEPAVRQTVLQPRLVLRSSTAVGAVAAAAGAIADAAAVGR